MDITDALAPTSDQLDAIELVNPRTFTIDTGSRLGSREGKTVAEIRLVGFPRVWRPSKGMLDVLAACWDTDAKVWVGHRVTLYNDPDVMFGRDKVGGVRISHLSHIDGPRDLKIRASGQGKTQRWHVNALPTDEAPDLSTITDVDELRALYDATRSPDVRAQIRARKAELVAAPPATITDPPADLWQDGGAES